jgi:hypothetical protein
VLWEWQSARTDPGALDISIVHHCPCPLLDIPGAFAVVDVVGVDRQIGFNGSIRSPTGTVFGQLVDDLGSIPVIGNYQTLWKIIPGFFELIDLGFFGSFIHFLRGCFEQSPREGICNKIVWTFDVSKSR